MRKMTAGDIGMPDSFYGNRTWLELRSTVAVPTSMMKDFDPDRLLRFMSFGFPGDAVWFIAPSLRIIADNQSPGSFSVQSPSQVAVVTNVGARHAD